MLIACQDLNEALAGVSAWLAFFEALAKPALPHYSKAFRAPSRRNSSVVFANGC